MVTDMNPHTTKASELCRFFTLGEAAKKALNNEQNVEQFLSLLSEKSWHPDAIQLIAHSLPKRQSVWWALQCAKAAVPEPTPEVEVAIKATERWIADPSEDNRRATLKAADEADTGTPAGCAALAAYYADGMPQTNDPKQNAKSYFLTAKLVSAAVLMSATTDPEHIKARFEIFVNKGAEVIKRQTTG